MMTLKPEALALMAEINSKLGKDTVVLGSDMVVSKRFTTGCLGLDIALGGGLPANQWAEVVGHESAGKTAMVFKCIAANQKLDPHYTVFWLASEHYDENQAAALGVDNSRVMVAPCQDMERGMDLLLAATESKAATCIVLDSYPAMIAKDEDEKGMSDATMAAGARAMNKFVRKAGKASNRNPKGTDPPFHGIIVNQFRSKVGLVFGDPRTTPGGQGKNYFFYCRIEVKRDKYLTETRPGLKNDVSVGQSIMYKTIKNKSAAPQQIAYVDFYYCGAPFKGFRRGDYDIAKECVTQGLLYNVIGSSGRWLTYGEDRWQSKDKMKVALREDIGLRSKLITDIMHAAANPELAYQIQPEQLAAASTETRRVKRSGRTPEKVA